MGMCTTEQMWRSEENAEVCSFLLPCRSQGPNSGQQTWWAPVPTEPSQCLRGSISKVVSPHIVSCDFSSSLLGEIRTNQVQLGEPVGLLGLPSGAPVTQASPVAHHDVNPKSWSILPGGWAAPDESPFPSHRSLCILCVCVWEGGRWDWQL